MVQTRFGLAQSNRVTQQVSAERARARQKHRRDKYDDNALDKSAHGLSSSIIPVGGDRRMLPNSCNRIPRQCHRNLLIVRNYLTLPRRVKSLDWVVRRS